MGSGVSPDPARTSVKAPFLPASDTTSVATWGGVERRNLLRRVHSPTCLQGCQILTLRTNTYLTNMSLSVLALYSKRPQTS